MHLDSLSLFRYDQTIPTFLEDVTVDLSVQSQGKELLHCMTSVATKNMQSLSAALTANLISILLLKNNVYVILMHHVLRVPVQGNL